MASETTLQRLTRIRSVLNRRSRPLNAREQQELVSIIIDASNAVNAIDNKIGFFGVAPVIKPTALTTTVVANASFTHVAPAGDDYLIQGITSSTPFGFVSANEGNSVLKILKNVHLRLEELEAKLQAIGLLT